MAYSNGNSVVITPDIGFTLSDVTEMADAGWPCVVAVAVKPGEGLGSQDQLWALGASSGNHWLTAFCDTSLSGPNTEAEVTFESRAGAIGNVTAVSTEGATIVEDEWLILVFRATSATEWEYSANGGPVTDISPVSSNGTPVGLSQLRFLHRNDLQYFADDKAAWLAFWGGTNFVNISDADMVAISGGTAPPTAHEPDKFIWFNEATAFSNEAETESPTTSGAGSIAEDAEDNPPGWPPGGAGVHEVDASVQPAQSQINADTLLAANIDATVQPAQSQVVADVGAPVIEVSASVQPAAPDVAATSQLGRKTARGTAANDRQFFDETNSPHNAVLFDFAWWDSIGVANLTDANKHLTGQVTTDADGNWSVDLADTALDVGDQGTLVVYGNLEPDLAILEIPVEFV